jgi:very-short-patch-repair endonuclease
VARIASRQRSLVTTEQLNACGLGRDAIAHRVRTGRFQPVFQSVYLVGCGELPPLARELAASLVCGKGSFISHQSAAFVWRMRKTAPPQVEVSVVGRNCWRRDGMRVHRIKPVGKREVVREQRLWVSTPTRTVLEIAATSPRDELVDVIDQGLALRHFTPADLKLTLANHRGRGGSARLAEVLADDTTMAISRSDAEKALLRLIRDARLPMPETNVKFGRFEADYVWREQRVIVELDSATYHSGPGVFQRDREKGLVLRGAGYDVLRPTRYHVVHEGARVLVLLAQALAPTRRDAA